MAVAPGSQFLPFRNPDGSDTEFHHSGPADTSKHPGYNPVAPGHEATVTVERGDAQRIAHSGRVKNLLEAGNPSYKSSAYISNRKDAEKELFGIDKSLGGMHRPVYGHLRDTSADYHGAQGYGDVDLDLWPGGKKITHTEGDSLDKYVGSRDLAAGSGSTPRKAKDWAVADTNVLPLTHYDESPGREEGDYRELQIHNRLRTSDIKMATIHAHGFGGWDQSRDIRRAGDTADALRKAGVPTRIKALSPQLSMFAPEGDEGEEWSDKPLEQHDWQERTVQR